MENSTSSDYSFDQALTQISQKCISQQKSTMEMNILGLEDDIDTCVNLYGYMRLAKTNCTQIYLQRATISNED